MRFVDNLGAWRWSDDNGAGVCIGEKLDGNEPGVVYVYAEMFPDEMRSLANDLLIVAAEIDGTRLAPANDGPPPVPCLVETQDLRVGDRICPDRAPSHAAPALTSGSWCTVLSITPGRRGMATAPAHEVVTDSRYRDVRIWMPSFQVWTLRAAATMEAAA